MKQIRQGEFLITKIHHVKGRIISKKLKENDVDEINPAQGRILFFLWQKDGVSIQELSKRTALEKSTLTCMLDRLEDAGFIRRVPCKVDRRKVLIHVTGKDEKMRPVYERVIRETNDILYQGFTEQEIQEFENYLNRVLKNLSEYDGDR
ncbi:MAG TPA: MarR family transcriptional regulator [Syntrophomonadaceae bacterium]|nr:MarR family transcriptional regulator [Syntrophomonadaceae bacterium]